MSRSIVAGNWKMHGSRQFVNDFVRGLAGLEASADPTAGQNVCGLILFPPAGYLAILADELAQVGLADRVEIGAQDLHPEPEGAYTGEMSGGMLRDLGAGWVLAGHSERREYAGETDELVARKVAAALDAGLRPVLCVGETESERLDGRAEQVVTRQLQTVIARCGASGLGSGAVAYEPVWAIGTGRTATPELAQEMHQLIRSVLAGHSAEVARRTPLLYGGSVKGANARALFAEQDIDGGLVGGASLEADEFTKIAGCLTV
jgi:triosephosphate isomerase